MNALWLLLAPRSQRRRAERTSRGVTHGQERQGRRDARLGRGHLDGASDRGAQPTRRRDAADHRKERSHPLCAAERSRRATSARAGGFIPMNSTGIWPSPGRRQAGAMLYRVLGRFKRRGFCPAPRTLVPVKMHHCYEEIT